jgi:thiol-disulfide isomerase/thioredoxin
MESKDYFSKSKYVDELTPSDFEDISVWKLKNKKCSIVLWYAPWCPHCKALKETWEDLGKIATFINVLSFNCEKYKGHLSKIQEHVPELVRGYPTIIIYKNGEPDEHYSGERTSKNLLKTCMRICQG